MKLYSAEEIWNSIPYEDKDNEAHKKQWVKLEDLQNSKYIS